MLAKSATMNFMDTFTTVPLCNIDHLFIDRSKERAKLYGHKRSGRRVNEDIYPVLVHLDSDA